MTLLVAGISDQTIWMVADTLITGPLGRRYDEHQIKVVPSADGKALIGFAGEQLRGTEAIEHARHMPAGTAALDYLIEVQRTYPVDFAYGHVDPSGPHLFRIVSGDAEGVRALQIGAEGAFEQFQSIRHRMEIEPVPHSISTFMMGTRSPDKPPETLNHAITAMLRLFSERAERDVGRLLVELGNEKYEKAQRAHGGDHLHRECQRDQLQLRVETSEESDGQIDQEQQRHLTGHVELRHQAPWRQRFPDLLARAGAGAGLTGRPDRRSAGLAHLAAIGRHGFGRQRRPGWLFPGVL